MAKAVEVNAGQRFCKYIRSVVFRANARYRDVARKYAFTSEMILHSDVFGVGVPYVVF